jgi:hypothetical protein
MDLFFILYLVISIIVGAGSVNFLYKRGQSIGAILTLLTLILIFYFYYLRWFAGAKVKGTGVSETWPPIVNVCPDFMASWKASDGKIYCYDAGDVYGMREAGVDSGLTSGLVINNKSGQSAYLMKNPTNNPNARSLQEDAGSAKRWPFLSTLKTSPSTILNSSGKGKYLKWEGVIEGSGSINANAAPLP